MMPLNRRSSDRCRGFNGEIKTKIKIETKGRITGSAQFNFERHNALEPGASVLGLADWQSAIRQAGSL
jgi:hypothetical protein